MTADTVISAYFPHKDPKTMYAKPTLSGLHNFHKILKYNANNMTTILTNGNYVLFPLIISPTDWENLYGLEFTPPNDSGAPPILAAVILTVKMKNIIHSYHK